MSYFPVLTLCFVKSLTRYCQDFLCFSTFFRHLILSGGWGHTIPQAVFMLQVRNIFALVISHFYGKIQEKLGVSRYFLIVYENTGVYERRFTSCQTSHL